MKRIPPVLVKGHLIFTLDDKRFEFVHQNISTHGVTGLPWGTLDKIAAFGRTVHVDVRIPGKPPIQFQTRAHITRETSAGDTQMGLRFEIDSATKKLVEGRIQENGFQPTEYIRKYPRIPSNHVIQTFPLRALVKSLEKPGEPQIVFDVTNLSPNGVLLVTENQSALSLQPGERIDISLEPRGWFPMPVAAQGVVRRISDELNLANRNLVRMIGVQFTALDDVNRSAFLELLKDILERLKQMDQTRS